jgi:YD repeat-containing protein
MTTPSGQTVTIAYAADGRISELRVNGQLIASEIGYFPFGEPKSWRLGNGATYARSFDSDGRIAEVALPGSPRTYSFDAASRITGITDGASAFTFGYDVLDRLASAAIPGTTLAWTYDALGNRLTETRNAATTSYTYSATSNRLASIAGTPIGFDAVGNIAADGTKTYTYSSRNRLTRINQGSAAFAYTLNGFGERVAKSVVGSGNPADTTQFVYDEDGRLIGEYDALGNLLAEHLWVEDTPVAVMKPAGQGYAGTPAGASARRIPRFRLARGARLLGPVCLARPEHAIGDLLVAVFAQFQDFGKEGLEGVAAMGGLVLLERAPERHDQRFAVLHRARHRLSRGRALVGDQAGVQHHEAAGEAGVGVEGLDVLAQHGDTLLQIVHGERGLQNDAVDGDHAVGGESGNEAHRRGSPAGIIE